MLLTVAGLAGDIRVKRNQPGQRALRSPLITFATIVAARAADTPAGSSGADRLPLGPPVMSVRLVIALGLLEEFASVTSSLCLSVYPSCSPLYLSHKRQPTSSALPSPPQAVIHNMSQADDVVSEYFDNDEADLILRSSAPEDKPAMIFKVTKKQLRRASPVFDDMLELGQIDSSSSLAVVQLAESSTVLELFLRFLLKSGPERPQYDGSFDAKIFARLLEVYECCFKYETDLLAAFVEALLQ